MTKEEAIRLAVKYRSGKNLPLGEVDRVSRVTKDIAREVGAFHYIKPPHTFDFESIKSCWVVSFRTSCLPDVSKEPPATFIMVVYDNGTIEEFEIDKPTALQPTIIRFDAQDG